MATSRTLPELLAYFIFLAFQIPLKRLLGYRAPVPEWSIRTEISVEFLKRMLDNTLESARMVKSQIARLVNWTIKDPIVSITEPKFNAKLIGPHSDSSPVILYFHGGGYSLCSATTYIASLSRLLAILKGRKVDAHLEYTLAPQGKFPTQLNEAVAALEYLAKTNRAIVLMGDSAGGNLVLTLLQKIKGSPLMTKIKGAVTVSPWVNTRNPPLSFETNRESDYVEVHQLESHMERLLPANETVANPLISPVLAQDFKGIPPLLVHYGGKELFAGDIQEFISKAEKSADVTVVIDDYAPHITPMMMPFFPQMAEMGLQAISDFIVKRI